MVDDVLPISYPVINGIGFMLTGKHTSPVQTGIFSYPCTPSKQENLWGQ